MIAVFQKVQYLLKQQQIACGSYVEKYKLLHLSPTLCNFVLNFPSIIFQFSLKCKGHTLDLTQIDICPKECF